MKRLVLTWSGIFLLFFCPLRAHAKTIPITPQWSRQVGFSVRDFLWDAATDNLSNTYTVGSTFFGDAWPEDAFIGGYDSAGNQLWLKRMGTDAYDAAYGVSIGRHGNIYVAGTTSGGLGGPFVGGVYDGFVSCFSSVGDLVWTHQLGTETEDFITDVTTDRLGNVFVAGYTKGNLAGPNLGDKDAFIARYNADGDLLWSRQFGTEMSDQAKNIIADDLGNIYVAGVTSVRRFNSELFLSKFDADGSITWTRQSGGLSYEDVFNASVDVAGNLILSGLARGSGGLDSGDGYVVKYSSAGDLLWETQIGTNQWDAIADALSVPSGNIYIGGNTVGSLDGIHSEVLGSAFIGELDTSHQLQWVYQFGKDSSVAKLSADLLGNLYAAGVTNNNTGVPNAGSWLIKFVVPEPSALKIFAPALVLCVTFRRQRLL